MSKHREEIEEILNMIELITRKRGMLKGTEDILEAIALHVTIQGIDEDAVMQVLKEDLQLAGIAKGNVDTKKQEVKN